MINDHEKLFALSRKDVFPHFCSISRDLMVVISNIIPQIHMLIVCLSLSGPEPLVLLLAPQWLYNMPLAILIWCDQDTQITKYV